MFSNLRKPLPLAITGFGCGIGLAMIGFLAAGFGHGSYVLIGLFSAPFGAFQNIVIALAAPPFLWGIAGLLVGSSKTSWLCRLSFLALMSVHYLTLFAILSPPSPFADWSYVAR